MKWKDFCLRFTIQHQINPDELYFKRLEELSLRKINNMNKLAKNTQVHGDSANLI